jgi:hypothetical protein
MSTKLSVRSFGVGGVNVDKDALDLDVDELSQAQNWISDPAKGQDAIRKRPGLIAFNVVSLVAPILGGSPLPGVNLSSGGNVTIYIGRGPSS